MHPIDVLKYGNLTLLSTIDGLTAAQSEVSGICGVWSVKNILAHLASYELVLVDVLASQLHRSPTPHLDRYLAEGIAFNDNQVDQRRGMDFNQTLDEYHHAHAQVMGLIAQMPESVLHHTGALAWYGAEYDLEDYLAYGHYGHKREHSAQIAVYRDTLKAAA